MVRIPAAKISHKGKKLPRKNGGVGLHGVHDSICPRGFGFRVLKQALIKLEPQAQVEA
jgi:hypothetical protein